MLTPELKAFIQRIPKAELHCHLEGSIQPATLLKLAAHHEISLPFEDEEGAKKFYEFENLNQFIDISSITCSTLQTAEDFKTITVELGADAARQNIPYREVFFTYDIHERRSIPWETVIEGIAAGRTESKERYGVEMWFIADMDRTSEPEASLRMVELAHNSRDHAGIIGVGMDSKEAGNPANRHQVAFDRAKELGFRLVAHAGEDAGSESVWDALNMGVERIDHGVRSIEDDKLLERLVEIQIPLTVCPVSNIALKVFPNMAAHPIKRLMDAGVFVTVNSDDPPMFHADVVDNYMQVADVFNLTADDVEKLARNSFMATFMDDAASSDYLERFTGKVSQLRAELFNQ
jgi:adenosine deaminase